MSLCWKEPTKIISPASGPTHSSGPVPPCGCCCCSNTSWALCCDHLPGKPIPGPSHPLCQESFTNTQPKPPLTKFHAIKTPHVGFAMVRRRLGLSWLQLSVPRLLLICSANIWRRSLVSIPGLMWPLCLPSSANMCRDAQHSWQSNWELGMDLISLCSTWKTCSFPSPGSGQLGHLVAQLPHHFNSIVAQERSCRTQSWFI